jgi:DNA polymerase III subunit beta
MTMSDKDIENFVVVEARALKQAMLLPTALVERYTTTPVLTSVKLTYGRSGLRIEATNVDTSVELAVDEIDGSGEWAICLPAKEISGIAAAAGVTPLRISAKKHTGKDKKARDLYATITAGAATYTVSGIATDEFPKIAGDTMQCLERFSNGQLAGAMKRVQSCISTEETRYYLNGIHWSSGPKGKRFSATDGHRLIIHCYGPEEGEAFNYIIPRKAAHILVRFLEGRDVTVHSIGAGNNINRHVLEFRSGDTIIRTKLIDGTFPDIDRVIPNEVNHQLSIRRDELSNAIRQATAICNQRHKNLRLHGVDGFMHIGARNLDDDAAAVSTSTQWPHEIDAIGLNSGYLTDLMRTCDGQITLGYKEQGAPIFVMDEDNTTTRLIMPTRV